MDGAIRTVSRLDVTGEERGSIRSPAFLAPLYLFLLIHRTHSYIMPVLIGEDRRLMVACTHQFSF